jgi:hypothetical protein
LCTVFFFPGFFFLFFFFFLWYWGLNSGPSPWATLPALFLWGVFKIGSPRTICLGWLQTMILLISASWVARITGVSHRHRVPGCFLRFPFRAKYGDTAL